MTNHRDNVGADYSGRVFGPVDARLAMAGEVHRDDAETGGCQFRREQAILLAHVAEAGDADDERAGAAGVVVGDLSVGQFEELRRAGCGRRLIGARRNGGCDCQHGYGSHD